MSRISPDIFIRLDGNIKVSSPDEQIIEQWFVTYALHPLTDTLFIVLPFETPQGAKMQHRGISKSHNY